MNNSVRIGEAMQLIQMGAVGRNDLSQWFYCLNEAAVANGISMRVKASNTAYAPCGSNLSVDEPLSMPNATLPKRGLLIDQVVHKKSVIKLPDVKICLDRALKHCGINIQDGAKLTAEGIFVSAEVWDAVIARGQEHPEVHSNMRIGSGDLPFNEAFIGGLLRLRRSVSRV